MEDRTRVVAQSVLLSRADQPSSKRITCRATPADEGGFWPVTSCPSHHDASTKGSGTHLKPIFYKR